MMGHNGGPPLDDNRPDEYNLNDRFVALAALEQERRDQKMLLVDMEDISGVSTNSFLAWRGGRRDPTLGCLVAVAQTLGFDVVMVRRNAGNSARCGMLPTESGTVGIPLSVTNRGK